MRRILGGLEELSMLRRGPARTLGGYWVPPLSPDGHTTVLTEVSMDSTMNAMAGLNLL